MTIQIEEGKFYRARDGRRVGPMKRNSRAHSRFMWEAPSGHTFTAGGCIFAPAYDHHLDLVAEWTDEPAQVSDFHPAKVSLADLARNHDRWMNSASAPKSSAQQKNEPGWKMDAGKPRLDLLAPEMLFGVSEILAFGAAKYGERNWEAGMSWGRCFGALMRHMWAWWRGEKADAETGKSHLLHAGCCLMFLIAYEERAVGTDDRPKMSVDVTSEV